MRKYRKPSTKEEIKRQVTIIKVLPNEGIRIAAEQSLLVMDIVVKLEDGSIANVEIQKIGYAFVPIDIFLKKKHNIDMSNRLNGWLLFLGSDDPADIIRLIEAYPEFKAMYQQIYEMCESVEDMMGLFSKELAMMDSNTVTYMMDEMQAEIDKQRKTIDQNKTEIDQQKAELDRQRAELEKKDHELEKLKQLVEQLSAKK